MSLREAMNANREQTLQLDEQLRNAHEALFEASVAPKFDEDALRQKAMAAAKLEAERNVLLAKAFSQMKPPLSAEQMAKIRTAPAPGSFDPGRGNPQRSRQGANSPRPDKSVSPKTLER
jgi:Spy/CpxP family protein refolding chaperone